MPTYQFKQQIGQPSVIWDKEKNKALCEFNKKSLITSDPKIFITLMKMGYAYRQLDEAGNPVAGSDVSGAPEMAEAPIISTVQDQGLKRMESPQPWRQDHSIPIPTEDEINSHLGIKPETDAPANTKTKQEMVKPPRIKK
jgi:hypothetical protein